MNGAQLTVVALQRDGIDQVFGLPESRPEHAAAADRRRGRVRALRTAYVDETQMPHAPAVSGG